MTFATYKDTPGRQAANVLELDLDYCSRSYGIAPCTANLALTNGLRQSEDFAITWGTANASVVSNVAESPLTGTMVADRITENSAASQQHRINISTVETYDLTKPITISGYITPDTADRWTHLLLWNGSDVARAWFNPDEGTVGGINTTGEAVVNNRGMHSVEGYPGWYRVWATITLKTTPATLTVGYGIQLSINDGQVTYSGNGASGVIATAAQIRPGLYPGKYAVTTTTAVDGGGTADDLCFNTFTTCQDPANFLKQARTLRFIDTLQRPVEFLSAYPNILSVRYAPTVIKPGGNLSIRGQVTVVLQDFATTDNEIDDYVPERSYNPEDQGTFFGKLKARNLYYIGRPMRVLEGYLDGADLADFRTREYIIDDISGPTADGRVTITGKDILSLASDVRAKCPIASTHTLRAAMTDTQTTLLPQIGEAATMLAGDKHIRINDEIIELVSEAPADTLNVVRERGGTTKVAHAINDAVQSCKTYEDTPVIDVVQDLLENFANVPSSFIPFTDWELEETESLSGYDMETIISEPTGVLTLLKEIAAITLLDIWYDDTDQEVKLKLQTPFTEVTEIVTDELDILKDSLKVKDLNNQRLTRVLIYYGIRNYARDLKETENFSLVNFEIDADKEGVNKYGDQRIKVIFSRWFDSTNATQVALTSQRLLARFGITPKQVIFNVDAKDVDRIKTGDVFDLVSRIEQDVDGTPATNRYQVTETKTLKPGSQYGYKAEAFFQEAATDSLVISTNQIDYDVFVELGGPPGPVDVTLTINAAIIVSGSAGNKAIITAGMHPDSTLRIVNNGFIYGHGGKGGKGGDAEVETIKTVGCIALASEQNGFSGSEGGDAIDTAINLSIDNTNGFIFAGAGGGGGGGGDADEGTATAGGGGGGGGGIGSDTALGGDGGDATEFGAPSCPRVALNGGDGVAGSTVSAGAGGAAGAGGGAGGAGGADWGDVGSDGVAAGADSGSGAIGGYAVRLNGNAVVWEAGNTPAKVKGTVG